MKTSGFRCETKFGLLVFFGHPRMLLLEIESDQFDQLGSTGGHWEIISGSFSVPFGSELEFQSQRAHIIVLSPWYNQKISLMILI